MNQKRLETLIKKVDTNTEFLVSRLTNMVALSASTTSQEVQASEMLQIEYNASMIVRLVEELLSVSRTLKENWILGQLPRTEEEVELLTAEHEAKINTVLSKILETRKFDEEVDEDSEEEAEPEEKEEEIKEEPLQDQMIPQITAELVDVKQEPKEEEVKQEEAVQPPQEIPAEPTQVPATGLEISDTADVLGDYDFDNFGSMTEQDNDDIIMIE